MTHPDCTAVIGDGDPTPNPLFTPPCQCPDCAPTETFGGRGGDDGWLRISGDRQRYRVEWVTLGEVGSAALGSDMPRAEISSAEISGADISGAPPPG